MTHQRSRLGLILTRVFASLALAVGLSFSPHPPAPDVELFVYDFDLGDDPARNLDYVRGLGYDGLVTRCSVPSDIPKLRKYADYAATLGDFDVLAYVNYDFNNIHSPQVWLEALPILSTLDAPLWVIVKNAPSATDVDNLLLTMAQSSALLNVPMVIYPHWNTNIESAAEAAARITQMGHPNVHNSLHTCHEIRSGNQYSMGAVVASHVKDTRLVTIAGAESNAYTGVPPHAWDDAIMPLDRGDYSLEPFLTALTRAGYDGPVILQTFGIAPDPNHLARSMAMYAKYRR